MGPTDVAIIAVIAALLAIAIRAIARSGSGGACAGCGSRGSCPGHARGGACRAADDMLARAERALDGKQPRRAAAPTKSSHHVPGNSRETLI